MIELLVEPFQAAVHGFPVKAQGAAVFFQSVGKVSKVS